jgi:hypothetical protein
MEEVEKTRGFREAWCARQKKLIEVRKELEAKMGDTFPGRTPAHNVMTT